MDTPPTYSRGSYCGRSRTPNHPSNITSSLHRPPTGRIARARSVSTLQFSEQNRRAIWEAATGQRYRSRPSELDSELGLQVIPPALLDLIPSTSAGSNSSLGIPETLSPSDSGFSASASRTSSLVEVLLDPQGLKCDPLDDLRIQDELMVAGARWNS
jgi:hypothetical protein